LSHDVLGSKQTVSQIDRSDFQRFIQQWYGLGNMVVVVAGDDSIVGTKKCSDEIQRAFGKKPESVRPKDKVKINKVISGKNPISSKRLHLQTKATEQAHFVLGWPGLERSSPSRYALTVLSTVLGGNMSSRLFTEVREKRGLCYYVHSDTDFFHDAGVFGASAGVDPSRVQEALEVIIAEFHALSSNKNPVTKQELAKAKEYLTGSMILSLEDSLSVAQYFGTKRLLTGEIESPESALAKIQAVTLSDVMSIAEQLITPDGVRLALIGPYDDKKDFEKFIA
jgi:predicted Zn-dependent peptidase